MEATKDERNNGKPRRHKSHSKDPLPDLSNEMEGDISTNGTSEDNCILQEISVLLRFISLMTYTCGMAFCTPSRRGELRDGRRGIPHVSAWLMHFPRAFRAVLSAYVFEADRWYNMRAWPVHGRHGKAYMRHA